MAMKGTPLEKDVEPEEEAKDAGTHGAVNPTQAGHRVQALDRIMDGIETKARKRRRSRMITSHEALEQVKAKIMEIVTWMAEASVAVVWAAIKDPTCLSHKASN